MSSRFTFGGGSLTQVYESLVEHSDVGNLVDGSQYWLELTGSDAGVGFDDPLSVRSADSKQSSDGRRPRHRHPAPPSLRCEL